MGNFSDLARNYSRFRPSYSESVISALIGLHDKEVSKIVAADVGAGTGIWSRQIASAGMRSVVGVEPNDKMRLFGEKDSAHMPNIAWVKGSGTETSLDSNSVDFVSTASAFHWINFEEGIREFHRILKPGGRFVALWNPRIIETTPLLLEIENKANEMAGNVDRVSSGHSGRAAQMTDLMWGTPLFEDVVYLEGRHVVCQSIDNYIGVWKSVNELQARMGVQKFSEFIFWIQTRLTDIDEIQTTYLTRAWSSLVVK